MHSAAAGCVRVDTLEACHPVGRQVEVWQTTGAAHRQVGVVVCTGIQRTVGRSRRFQTVIFCNDNATNFSNVGSQQD